MATPERMSEARELNRRLVYSYLRVHPCVDCGESDADLLDFDHVRGVKRDSVSRMVLDRLSWMTLFREIAKCVVRCVVCHRKKTLAEQRAKYQRKHRRHV